MKNTKNKFSLILLAFLLVALSFFGIKNTSLAQTGSVRLSLSSASSVNPGSSVDLNVSIDTSSSAQNPRGVQWDFIFNTNDVSSIVWKSNGPAAVSAGKSVTCSTVSAGILRCLVLGFNTNTISSGVLGTITVTLKSSASVNSIPINFSGLLASNATGTSMPITATGGTISLKQAPTTNQNNLTAICRQSLTESYVGRNVKWSASVVGGSGTRQYVWSGSENLSGTGSSASVSYTSTGSKNASVKVTSGTESVTAQCPTINIIEPPITGTCGVRVSPLSDSEYNIYWKSSLRSPVSSTPSYSWSGTDGLSSSVSSVSKRYGSQGIKTGNVSAQSGSKSFNFGCSANVQIDTTPATNTRTLGGSCSPSVSGMSVTWSASGSGGSTANPITYSWSGSDGLASNLARIKQTYTSEGVKTGTVRISSGDQSLILTCEARVAPTANSSSSSGGGCFIATAVFGTDMEPEVVTLRNFRDETLLTNKLGKVFVDIYYKISPPIADLISENEPLKAVVRTSLEPIVFGLDKLGYNW